MRVKLLVLLALAAFGLFLSTAIRDAMSSSSAIVRMITEKSYLGPEDVGSTFRIAVVAENLLDLYGFDIQLKWTTDIIKYVSHTTTVPRTSYPAPNPPSPYEGALNPPTIPVKDIVNEADAIPDAEPGTMGWFAYASMGAPTGQTGNATIVVFTFNVTNLPTNPIKLKFVSVDLANMAGQPIAYEALDLTIPVLTKHSVTIDTTEYEIRILSNSSVSNLQLNAPEPEIIFNVAGDDGTKGFCNVTIPKSLIWAEDGWIVLIDGLPATTFEIAEDTENTYVYIVYQHSSHEIKIRGTTIVPEFQGLSTALVTATILMTTTLMATTVIKLKSTNKKRH